MNGRDYANYFVKGTFNVRGQDVEKRIRMDKKSIGVVADMRRSMMYTNLLSLLVNEIIREDDLKGFSEELSETVKYVARQSKAFAERI